MKDDAEKALLEFAKLFEGEDALTSDFINMLHAELQPRGAGTSRDGALYPAVMSFIHEFNPDPTIYATRDVRGPRRSEKDRSPPEALARHFDSFYVHKKDGPRGYIEYVPPYLAWFCSLPKIRRNEVEIDRQELAKNFYNHVLTDTSINYDPKALKKWDDNWSPPWVDVELKRVFSTWQEVRDASNGVSNALLQPKKNPDLIECDEVLQNDSPKPVSDSYQPNLPIPKVRDRSHHFSSRPLKVLGRDKEEKILETFISDEKNNFRWIQISGEAGQGKSRLALKLADGTPSHWNAGFLFTSELKYFRTKWRDWNPDKPTLIIIDDVIADLDLLRDLFCQLSARNDLSFSVRVIIIERQPWRSTKTEAPLKTDDNPIKTEEVSTAEVSDWFSAIVGTNKNVVIEKSFEPDVIELGRLEVPDLLSITRLWSTEYHQAVCPDKPITVLSDDEIIKHLATIDQTGRPLFAYFLGESLAFGEEVTGWKMEDLLTSSLRRDMALRWSQYFEGEAPNLEDNHLALKIAVLATMIRKFNTDNDDVKCEIRSKTRKQALAITNGAIRSGGQKKEITGLQPDILGEWLVVSAFAERSFSCAEVVKLAWAISPNEMTAFLVRLSRDFPNHTGTFECFDKCEDVDESTISSVISTIFYNLNLRNAPISSRIIEWLKANAASGCGVAMSNLGTCHERGIGVELNLQEAFYWYQKGAATGFSGAIANLALCYLDGLGVEKDQKRAFQLYNDSAAKGCAQAMNGLGICHKNGFGTPVNHSLAVDCFRKGVELKYGDAISNLGLCYENGKGVEANASMAAALYYEAIHYNNAPSMFHLGRLYLDGKAVEQNEETAFFLFEQASNAGSRECMQFLGFCYEKGRGVVQNFTKAEEYYEQAAIRGLPVAKAGLGLLLEKRGEMRRAVRLYTEAAALGNALGATALGSCYEDGKGVDEDLEAAFMRYIQGAILGNPGAMTRLGLFNFDGKGMERNYQRAFYWFLKAATHREIVGMKNTATCYQLGYGTEQNILLASYWESQAKIFSEGT